MSGCWNDAVIGTSSGSAAQYWKTAHVVSATVVFGTGLGIAFFCWFGTQHALRSGSLSALRTILRLTVLADWCFTAPAVMFQLVSGLMLMHLLGWAWFSPWSLVVLGLFVLVGLCWLPVVMLQLRLRDAAYAVATLDALPVQFFVWLRWWFGLGIIAFTLVLALFYLMVGKPLAVFSGQG